MFTPRPSEIPYTPKRNSVRPALLELKGFELAQARSLSLCYLFSSNTGYDGNDLELFVHSHFRVGCYWSQMVLPCEQEAC